MLIVGNWKAYVEDIGKAKRLHAVGKRLAASGRHEIVLAPAAPHLGYLAVGNRSNVEFASQDISLSLGGAATGEVTAATIAGIGAAYAILGHSERRAAGETDETVREKARLALANGLIPILCIGERVRDPDAQYLHGLRNQIATVFEPLAPKERKSIVIAYEPVWAIGKSAADAIAPTDLAEMALYIRKVLADFLPGTAARSARLLYGGSVEPGNVRALATDGGIDGFLIGRASTDAAAFGALVKALA